MKPNINKYGLILLIAAAPVALVAAPLSQTMIVNANETENKHPVTDSIVKSAVEKGADDQNWTAKLAGTHRYILTKTKGSRFVTVSIDTSDKGYMITYVNSRGLHVDSTTQTIDDDYDSWLTKLNKEIQSNIVESDVTDEPEQKKLMPLEENWSI